MHEVATRNDIKTLRGLLDADPGLLEAEQWVNRRGPLTTACGNGCVEAATLLLDRGAGIDEKDWNGHTPLTEACRGGHVGVVSLVLARGADPSVRTSDTRFTALMKASSCHWPPSDHVAVLCLLLKDGRVPVDAQDLRRETALHIACSKGHTERVVSCWWRVGPTTPSPMLEAPRPWPWCCGVAMTTASVYLR